MTKLSDKLREAAKVTPDREIAAPLLFDAAEALERWSIRYGNAAEALNAYCPGEPHLWIEDKDECQRCGATRR